MLRMMAHCYENYLRLCRCLLGRQSDGVAQAFQSMNQVAGQETICRFTTNDCVVAGWGSTRPYSFHGHPSLLAKSAGCSAQRPVCQRRPFVYPCTVLEASESNSPLPEHCASSRHRICVVGQEKSGAFWDHLQLIGDDALTNSFFIPDHTYIRTLENRYSIDPLQERPMARTPTTERKPSSD